MKKWWLEITLHSDMCVATGDSEQGIANVKTAMEYGIPYIPAKRLKGALLNEGKEMVSNSIIEKRELDRVFGAPGLKSPAMLHIGDAQLYRIPGALLKSLRQEEDVVLEEYDKEIGSIKNHPSLPPRLAEHLLTRSRTRTALDKETGSAQDTTLRTLQIVPRGMVFRSLLTMYEKDNGMAIETLNKCVKALRHIGLGITRGYGEVSCVLREISVAVNNDRKLACQENSNMSSLLQLNPQDRDGEEQINLCYEIELFNPVLFSGEKGFYEDCCDYIPGAAIMGALAAMYIEDYKLGEYAQENENFRRIFLRNGVCFGNGYLKQNENIFYPTPAFLAVEKTEEGKFINRLTKNGERVRRREIASQVYPDWNKRSICLADVEKEIRMHHARPADRGIGHAVNDRIQDGAEDMGQFFQYTSLSKGQIFSGKLQGKKKDIQVLMQCLKERNYQMSLGRSRTAEYGAVRLVRFLHPIEEKVQTSKHWLLWVVSPLVFKDCGNYISDSELERLEKRLTDHFKAKVQLSKEKCILKYCRIGGYNSKWNLPLPQYMALAPGSVIDMELMDESKTLCKADLEREFWGDITGRGYGQILALPGELADDTMENYKKIIMDEEKRKVPETTDGLLAHILIQYKSEQEQTDRERLNALQVESNLTRMTTIEQIIGMVEGKNLTSYEEIKELIDKIKDEEKRKAANGFMKPCQGQGIEFIKTYLLSSKWKVRREGKQ
ncbi:RAMP superfamily CRISPR-associated protein [Anaerolentibacter hominis]|uniref:RAMP superfamily CRISPR-associated protein n=1 Tax=Anaerolentibacter hominis TaxID=3079009 RepID=UPI0031B8522A